MSRHIDLTKDKLTDDEERYVLANNYLRLAREEYLAHGTATSQVAALSAQEPEDHDEDDEEEGVSVEEWVASANKQEVISELKRRDIEHNPKSSKDDLGALLIASVQE